jgi:hypothetical protein
METKEKLVMIKIKIKSWKMLMAKKIETGKTLGQLADEAISKVYGK